jgi:hypothetical protein
MKYLRKIWFRILISLFAGGMSQEIIFLSTGDPTRSRKNEGSGIMFLVGIIIYILLTIYVKMNTPKRIDKIT